MGLDWLEARTLLSNVTWTGAADGKNWAVAGNWSGDAVPGSSDDVTINLAGNPTIQISTGSQSVHSLTSSDPIAISGGSLSVAANSTISGGLAMTGGSLTASGSGVVVTVTGATTDTGGSLYAQGGASLSLAQLTSYTGNGNTTTLEATGDGSTLDLSNLAGVIEAASNYPASTQFEALAGGTVMLPALQSVSTGTVVLESDSTNSVLNVSALTSFTESNGWEASTLQASNGGTVEDSSLATLSNVNLNVAGAGENLTLASLTSYGSGDLTVSGGATLSLPGLTGYTGNGGTTTLEATGIGSVLTLASLTTITEGASNYPAASQFEAMAGGTVTLSALKTIDTGTVVLESDGANSSLNVSALTGFTEANGWTTSTLQATGGGTVSDGVLTSLSGVNLTIDGSSTIATAQLTSYAGGSISIDGGSPSFAGLTSLGGSDLTVSGGGTVSLPGVTSYTGNGNTTTLEATGTGSALTLANLASVTEAASNYPAASQFEALAGGAVTLSALKTINTGTVVLESDGSGSVLNVSALTGFDEANGWTISTLQVSNGGTVDDSSLASLTNVNVNIIGTAEKLTLGALTSYGSGNITVSGGATLSLPGLTGYTGNGGTTTLEATGTGSVLTLANLTTITESASNYPAASQFETLAGGTVNLPALKTIDTGTVVLESDGANSSLNVSALTGFTEANGWTTSTLQATGGGTVSDGVLTRLSGVNLTIDGSSTIATAQLSSFAGATMTIDGGAPSFAGLTSFNGSDITVSGGGTVSLPSVTGYTGNGNTTTLEATGTGSTLTLAALATVTESANNYPAASQFEALAGGTVTVSGLHTINTGTVVLESDGAGSVLNVSALTGFAEANGWTTSTLQASNGGTVDDGSLATLSNVNVNIIGTAEKLTLGALTSYGSGDLTVSGGATLSLPGLTGYAGNGGTTTLEATGTGSVLTLANLTTITESASNYPAASQFEALAGGTVNLPALKTIDTGTAVLESDGANSSLNVSALTEFTEANGWTTSTLQATGGGTVSDGVLTSLSGVNLTIDGSSTIATAQLTSYAGGSISISGGSPSFAGLTSFNGSDITVSGGGTVSLPGVTGYAGNGNTTTLEATGTGSALTLANLASVTEAASNYPAATQFEALAGGTVTLSGLHTINTGTVVLESDGAGSVLNVSALTGFAEANGWTTSTLQASNGGTVDDGSLATLSNVNVDIIGTAEKLTLNSLTSYGGGNITVSAGATLSLPGLTGYAGNGGTTTLEATGTGSVLTLANLATITESASNYPAASQFEALAGGTVNLPALKMINTGTAVLESDGANSSLNISALTGFSEANGWTTSTLQATGGGAVNDGALTRLSGVNLTIDGSSTIATAQLSSFVGGSISIDGGSPRFSGLTSFNGSDITVSGGGTVSLPAVTGYTGNGNTTTLEATGAGSTLTLPNLATVTEGANNYPAATQFEALAGGSLTLPALKTINTGTVVLESDGTNSLLDLPALTLFDEVNGWTASVLQDSNGGTLIDPSLSGLSGVNLVGDATGTFTITASLGLTITGGTTNVQVGTLVDQGDLSIQNGATLNLQGGLTVNGAGVLTAASGSTIEISGNLLGNTQNADDFVPMGTVELNSGLGTSKPPQELEAMSADLGATQAGFVNNFAYDTISLTANTSVELVDQSTNTTSGKPEAVYADELIVPAGATLNLNNLHLYVRGDQVSGTVVGGTITAVPSGGSIALNTPTPATLTPAGAIDNWTFYGTAGESITIQLNPGGGGSNPAISPTLNWGQVALLSSGGSSLATASSASSGAIATISGLTLPANGTYTIQVQAAQGQSSSSGNYVLSAYNVTANVQNLTLNQRENGTIRNPYGLDQWVFTGSAGQQVQLVAVSASGGVQFDLNGPGNQTLFSDLQADSGLITLPASGQYVLTAHGSGGQGGAYAFALDQTSVTNLTLGGSDSGTLAGSGQAQLFEVTVPATQSLIVGLQDNTATDVVQLFANLGSPPTPFNYGESSGAGSSDPKLLVPSAAPGTWYILVYAASVSSSSPFTIQATGAQVQLSTVAPDRSATGSPATLTLTGSGFDGTTTVSLISASNQVYMASTVSFDTPTQLTATFSLSGVPQGVYSVEVTRAGDVTSTLPGAFTVLAQGSAQLETHLILPSEMGRHVSSTIYVEYSNTGSVAMPAPLLVLYAPPEVIDGQTIVNLPLLTLDPSLVVSGYWTSALPAGYSNSVQILASGKVPGWLEPGESVTVPVYYAGMQQPWSFAESSFDFKLDYYTQQDKTPADWSSLGSSLQPPGISGTAWSAIYAGLSAQLGNTWGGYVKMLDDEANYLGQLGEDVTDVNSLWAMAVTQADGLSPATELDSSIDLSVTVPGTVSLEFDRLYQPAISSRDATGPLGFGWTDNWQYSLSVASDGTVTVDMPGGEQRIFQPDSRPGGGYFAEPGDQGILTADAGGAFTLQESDGQIETFNADGTLDYIQDTDGNRITAGYTGGRLTSLTDNSEGSLAITYNAAGLIATVASADGRTVSYTYDSTDHLIGVQEYSGATTQYTYDASSNPSIQNALTSIAFTDGTHQYFTYNTQGQLTGVSSDGGAQPLTFQYNEGEVTVTDAAGDSAEYYYNEQAEVVKYVDPLGNSWFGTYDSTGDLTSLEAPTGLTQTFTYDSQGNVISTTDPLGQTTTFSYTGPYNSLSSVTNAAGQTTSLSYDANGDLTSVENADDSVSTATYDALGDPLTLTNANGQATSYTYNAAGQVASVTLSDGTTTTYAYDSHGNLTTATDAAGVTTLTYNSADLLTGVSYPTGLSLQYTYDAGGRRTQMVELSGSTVTYTVNYSYTASGQLSRLTDGSGNLIIAYTYNTQGELTREDKGDGTYTTYTYDAEGNILDLVNDSAGGQVDSSFAYTYNALGEVTTMVTVDGTWTYSYDSDEQLIHAAFASTNSQIPSQDLTYVYNAAGDRVQTIVNGVTTNDTSNSVNEYTTVGGTTYGYDASGNLISETNSSGTTTFAYDSENRLISETSGSNSWIYEYDALGNLSATIYDGQTTTDLVDPIGAGNLVAQFSGTGSTNPIASYTYGLGLVSQVTPGGTNYYQFDALGSTAGLTNQASGLVATYQYSPFGGVLSSTGALANPFTFVGEYGVTSAGNGLYDMRARSYDPSTGSFISEDPLRIQPTFAYAANNPVSTIDATGLSSATPPQVIHFNDPNYDSGYYISQPWGNYPGNSILINDYYANAVPHWGDITYYHEYSHWYYENVLNPGALHGGTQDELYAHSKSAEYAKKMGWEDARRAEQRFVDQILKTKRPPVSRVSGIILKLSAHLPPPPPPVTVVCVPLPTSDTGYSFDTSGATMCNPSSGSSGGGGAGTAGAYDPNSLQGPSGYGPSNYVPGTAKAMFPYQIDFENAPTATAPAQQVTVTEILDPNLDLSTFQWTGIGWGDTTIAIPPGTQDYRTTVPMTYNGVTFDVVVNATLDVATRELTVTFQSIDPATSLPPNLLTGFLPPEDGTGRGEGYVSYLIAPNAGLATGTAIRSVANIVFDGNPAIATDQVSDTDPSQGTDPTKQALITIDNTRPTSSVNPLPAVEDSTSFTVSWGGSDGNGSGIQFYDIVYSDDGGTPQTWQSMTTQTSAVFTGQAGHTYTFYSVAYSNTAFLQQVPATPQAQTTIAATAVPSPTPSPTTPSPTPSPTSPSPTPSPTTPSPTPSSTSTSVPPTIIGEQALFTRKLNQKHKPVGKPTLAGFELQFSSAMNAATAGNAGNYQVAWSSTKRVKKKLTTLLHPVPFSAQYDAATHSVSLILTGKQAFAQGGQITVIATPPDGVSGDTGVLLDGGDSGVAGDNGVFTIQKGGKGITGP